MDVVKYRYMKSRECGIHTLYICDHFSIVTVFKDWILVEFALGKVRRLICTVTMPKLYYMCLHLQS